MQLQKYAFVHCNLTISAAICYPVRVCAAGLCVWSSRFVCVRICIYIYPGGTVRVIARAMRNHAVLRVIAVRLRQNSRTRDYVAFSFSRRDTARCREKSRINNLHLWS